MSMLGRKGEEGREGRGRGKGRKGEEGREGRGKGKGRGKRGGKEGRGKRGGKEGRGKRGGKEGREKRGGKEGRGKRGGKEGERSVMSDDNIMRLVVKPCNGFTDTNVFSILQLNSQHKPLFFSMRLTFRTNSH